MVSPDLDSPQNIEMFVEAFYQKLLLDPQLAPIFVNVANIDLAVHLPHIKNYWCKLLLSEQVYSRHTMNIHRQLHARRNLTASDFQRWLALFVCTVDENFSGNRAEHAKKVASSIVDNMKIALPVAGHTDSSIL